MDVAALQSQIDEEYVTVDQLRPSTSAVEAGQMMA